MSQTRFNAILRDEHFQILNLVQRLHFNWIGSRLIIFKFSYITILDSKNGSGSWAGLRMGQAMLNNSGTCAGRYRWLLYQLVYCDYVSECNVMDAVVVWAGGVFGRCYQRAEDACRVASDCCSSTWMHPATTTFVDTTTAIIRRRRCITGPVTTQTPTSAITHHWW